MAPKSFMRLTPGHGFLHRSPHRGNTAGLKEYNFTKIKYIFYYIYIIILLVLIKAKRGQLCKGKQNTNCDDKN
jgi:hypothetical protein